MKNVRGKKEVALVASGIILGAAIAAPAAGAVLTAQQSRQGCIAALLCFIPCRAALSPTFLRLSLSPCRAVVGDL